MDRIEAASEASFPPGTRTADFPSYYGDPVCPSVYPSSLSLYNAFDAKPIRRDGHGIATGFSDPLSRDGLGIKAGHTKPLIRDGYGGYSYSSSYDDMRRNEEEGRVPFRRHSEGIKSYEVSANGRYGYGADEGSSFCDPYEDPSFDMYYKSLRSPLTSALYGKGGPMSGNRYHNLPYHGPSGSYQYDYSGCDMASFNKPDVLPYEPSVAIRECCENLKPHELTHPHKDAYANCQQVYHTRNDGISGESTMYQQSSGSSRMCNYNYSRVSPAFGALDDWRNAGERVRNDDAKIWQHSGTLSSNSRESYALGRVENSSGDSVYPDLRDLNKVGTWDGGVIKQTQPEIGQKGNIESGSKIIDYKESSLQMLDIESGREAMGKKRQSRWEPVEEYEKGDQNGSAKKRKKSRWSEEKPSVREVNLADILKGADCDAIALRAQLIFINSKLQSGQVVDDRPEAERSPSPEPIFDNFGYQVNTREFRARKRLTKERQCIITKLAKKSLTHKPPPDFKPSKFLKKLYVPVDKYPDYNFIGLIIGPRGHTQKKMEKESGARIFIRGKGSIREGSSAITSSNESENLHVLIEADTEDSLNKAVGMVEKLLVPLRDGQNEHKKAQLRELAMLNGTLQSSEICRVCKEAGHVAKDCPMAGSTAGSSADVGSKSEASGDSKHCHVCNEHGHLSKDCPSSHPISGSLLKGGSLGMEGHQVMQLYPWIANDSDDTLLYVAFLPQSINDSQLRSLFSPFGQVVHAKVMRHLTTGISKSYGFVKFLSAADAAQAVTLMNGYKLDGNVVLVKVKTSADPAS